LIKTLNSLTMCHVTSSQVFIVGSLLEPILNATLINDNCYKFLLPPLYVTNNIHKDHNFFCQICTSQYSSLAYLQNVQFFLLYGGKLCNFLENKKQENYAPSRLEKGYHQIWEANLQPLGPMFKHLLIFWCECFNIY
jgi:hypothetical protein